MVEGKSTRRALLQNVGLATAGAIGSAGMGVANISIKSIAWRLLTERVPERPKVPEGKLLLALHTHVPASAPLEDIIDVMMDRVIGVGISSRRPYTVESYKTFSERVEAEANRREDLEYEEIVPGILGKIERDGREGYWIKSQEIYPSARAEFYGHLVAVGFQGNYFDRHRGIIEAAREIREREGLVILAHPNLTEGKILPYVCTNEQELDLVREMKELGLLDGIESFNSQQKNVLFNIFEPVPFIPCAARANIANVRDAALAEELGMQGMAADDSRRDLDYVGVVGNLINKPEGKLTIPYIFDKVRAGEFEQYGNGQITMLGVLKELADTRR